jgi:hypothetical protein
MVQAIVKSHSPRTLDHNVRRATPEVLMKSTCAGVLEMMTELHYPSLSSSGLLQTVGRTRILT